MDGQTIMKSFSFDGIHNDKQRVFKCWGSVEVLDRHNEIIPAEEIYKIMDIWMDRGSPIMFNHTNRQVGKGLNWQPLEKNGKPGVLITAKIYDHYSEDDSVWKGIKNGAFEGLSIGGKSFLKETTEEGTYLKNLIGYEFSVVERTGNQEATFVEVNQMAKSEEIIKEESPEVVTEEVTKEETQSNEDTALTDLKNMVEALVEKLSSLESRVDEMTAGAPEQPEETVEEQKAEDSQEEESVEEPAKEDEEMTKKYSELESKVEELTKALEISKQKEVVEVVKSERPEEKVVESNPLDDIRKSYLGKSKINFVEVGQKLRELK